MNIENILIDKLTTIFGRKDRALDIALILGFINQIFTAIRGCRTPEAAKAVIREGGAISYGQALLIVRKRYRGAERREKAIELVEAGKSLDDEQLEAMVSKSRDIPQPPPLQPIWPVLALFCFLIPAPLLADEPMAIWPIDIEQNRRLDDLDARTKKIEAKLWFSDEKRKAESKTATCQCEGSKRGVCFCLQKGIACKCSPGVGSVWSLDEKSKPVAKTGAYANPNSGQPVQKPAPPTQQAVVQVIPQPQYQYVCRNGYCRRLRLFR